MADEKLKKLAEKMYDIEVEMPRNEDLDPVFELIRKRGGSVYDQESKDFGNDPSFNSRDHRFLKVIKELGLIALLEEKVDEAYGD